MNDPTPHLERFESYEQACRDFQWLIPQRFNIADAICRRHPDGVTRVALTEVREAGLNTYTFGGLDFLSDKFATALSDLGVNQGDSVAMLLPQSAALAIAQLATLKCAGVVVPLPMDAGLELVKHALSDSSAKVLVADEAIFSSVESLTRELPNMGLRFVVRDLRPAATSCDFKDFWSELDRSSSDFDAVETAADSAAFIFYPESQHNVAGIVHSHRSIVGQLTSFEMFYNPDRDAGSVFWTAEEWSAAGAALGVLYPAWWYGCSLVAGTPEDSLSALRMMERCEVTHLFLPASPPKALADSEPELHEGFELKARTVVSERLRSPEHWVNNNPGVTLNEVYGKAETGWIVGGCARWFPSRVDSVGRTAPGRSIEIIDAMGEVLSPHKAGRVAVRKSDPGLFTEFHNAPERTAASFIRDWFLTGDYGYKNDEGDLYVLPYSDKREKSNSGKPKTISGVRSSAVCPEPET